MGIDFSQISGPKGSKADNFALMCTRLICAEWPEANPVEGKGGDEGLDTYIGEIDRELKAFQFKYFCDRIRKSQRAQIETSLRTASKHHHLLCWTLVLPVDMNLAEQRWFCDLCKKHAPLKMDWWGETKLRNLLSVHPEITEDFFEPTDALKFRDMTIKHDGTVLILKEIRKDLSNIGEKINVLIEITKQALQITPNQPTEMHEKFIRSGVQELIHRSRLSVLVWGPQEEGDKDLFKKRGQILDRLRDLGHQADFSEDILTSNILAAGGINLSVAELLQARGYEYIICIMDSPGSVGEVHDFCHMPEIAHKMTICINEERLSGYSGQGILRIFEGNHGHLEKFKIPDDLNSCSLRDRAVEQVEKRAAAKQDQIARSAGV
jgi:hypothetical protein